jgi:hypothetical protein
MSSPGRARSDTNNCRMDTIISNTDMDSNRDNSESEFGYTHFSVHISNQARIPITIFTFTF